MMKNIQKVMPKEPSGKSTSVRSLQATPKGSTTSDDLERAIRLRVVFEPDSPGDSYYCSSCEKHLKTKQTMRAHLSTPTHLSKTDVRTAIPQFLSSPGPQKQVAKLAPDGDGRVNICNSSKHGSSRHYDRANPVEKAFADGILVDEGAGKDSKGPFWCSVCNQTLKTFGKLSAHLSSKKHNGKLVKKNLCAGGKDDQRCNGETSDSSGSDSCGSESYSSSPSDSDSCDDDEDDEDERLVSKALRDGILQDDTLTHPMSPYWCKVCLLSLRQYRRLAGHLRSNKHRAKVSDSSCRLWQLPKPESSLKGSWKPSRLHETQIDKLGSNSDSSSEDEWENTTDTSSATDCFLLAMDFANKLKKLPKEKSMIAQKLISDILFEAQRGCLNKDAKICYEKHL